MWLIPLQATCWTGQIMSSARPSAKCCAKCRTRSGGGTWEFGPSGRFRKRETGGRRRQLRPRTNWRWLPWTQRLRWATSVSLWIDKNAITLPVTRVTCTLHDMMLKVGCCRYWHRLESSLSPPWPAWPDISQSANRLQSFCAVTTALMLLIESEA